MSTPIEHGLCEIEAADLRAEVESLRAERDAAYGQGVNDGQDSMRNENMVQVESLRTQLAAAREANMSATLNASLAYEDLAAVRTDLSVARAEIERLRQDKEGQR